MNQDEPKILLFDIETAPNLAWCWGKYEQNVLDYVSEWYMMSFAYKWLGDKEVHCHSLPEYKAYKKDKEDDSELIRDLWDLFSKADVIIGHNSDSFDIRKANARFIYHGLVPPQPYKTVDTKKVAKQHFYFNSNSLNDLGKHLKLGKKVPTGGFSLWQGCMSGDSKSWKTMVDYNKQDVTLLEKIYNRLRPWIRNHPNIAGHLDGEHCPKCGSDHLQSRGFSRTLSAIYRRFHCQNCGGWSRVTTSEKGSRTKVTNL